MVDCGAYWSDLHVHLLKCCPYIPPQVFDLHQCYDEMQKQAAEACAAVAAQTAAVRGSGMLGQSATCLYSN